jgi:predicted nucleotidyltransferase
MREQAVNTIMEAIAEFGFRVEKIILFGSRARGEARAESDWDFLVVLNDDLTFAVKLELIVQIKRRLAAMRIPNDIIVKSLREFEMSRDQIGTVSYFASLEGITV